MNLDKLYLHMMKQPHVLIAGCTGSGKSVAVNGLIRTITAGPVNENQLILIDPKRVELVDWSVLPHCIRYASERPAMLQALQYAIDIMETRYRDMQVRRIRKYDGGHVWVIIDELQDLMTTLKKEAAPRIQRLAQLGRAAGVHVVACTQSPLREIIPTPIKCNFDCRLGLRTACAQDSRNILGEPGLERLPEHGYGMYRQPLGTVRVPIPYYTDDEIRSYIDDRRRNPNRYWEIAKVTA